MNNSSVKMFNLIRENSSEAFFNTVPSATSDNIQSLSNILFNENYQPLLNEFVTSLINRISLTVIKMKSFNNPLAILKKGSVPLGTDIQEIYSNPAQAEQYGLTNTDMALLLTRNDPDTKVAYYRRNRQDLYTKTIAREALQGAFTSWEKFGSFVESITQTLYSGNYIDEFKYTKALIDGAYDNNKVITKVVENPDDEASDKAFVKTLRGLYTKMRFPSSEYNAYSVLNSGDGSVTTWTEPERIVVIITSDVEAEIDVEVLASAFNMNKTDFLGRVIVVDKFENDAIKAVICDESWLQIYDNVLRTDEFYNARTMSWNEYLHAWGTFAISPLANAVALVTEAPKPATAIDAGEDVTLDMTAEDPTETVTITLTPADATSEVTYTSSDEAVFTVEKVTNTSAKLTPVAAGSATLTVSTDNGLSDTADVTVTNE